MATLSNEKVNIRLVVLVKPREKKLVQSLARKEKVSTSEIVRRSLHSYTAKSSQEEAEVSAAIGEMNEALDKALLAVRSARREVASNIAAMRRLRSATK
jgi:hypothetical protein